MMKKLIYAMCMVGGMLACTQKTENGGYTISGTAEGTVDGDTVYLCEVQGYFSMLPLDSAYVKDGKFEFKGQTEGANIRVLMPIHNGKPLAMSMFILENADIKATLSVEGKDDKYEGGPNGELYKQFIDGENKLAEQMEKPWTVMNDSTSDDAAKDAARQVLDSLQVVQKNYHRQFIIDHVPSALSDLLFAYSMQEFNEDEQEEILKLFGEKQPDMPYYKRIMAERKASEASAVGGQYMDIALAAPDGKTIKVSDYVSKNKYTLIDFWASWCGPCRAEMPTVVKAYADFHQKGFEVVGVSLDNDKDAWVKAIADLKMPWPQMSDLKGWDCEGAQLYNVRSIPSNVLVDQQGKIVAKDLRGEQLLKKLDELF